MSGVLVIFFTILAAQTSYATLTCPNVNECPISETLNKTDFGACLKIEVCISNGHKLVEILSETGSTLICYKHETCPALVPFESTIHVGNSKYISCVATCPKTSLLLRAFRPTVNAHVMNEVIKCRHPQAADGSDSNCMRNNGEFPEIYDLKYEPTSFGPRTICNEKPERQGVLIQKHVGTGIPKTVEIGDLYTLYMDSSSVTVLICPWDYVVKNHSLTIKSASVTKEICIFDEEKAITKRREAEEDKKVEEKVNDDVEDLGLVFMYIFLLILGVVASLEVISTWKDTDGLIRVPKGHRALVAAYPVPGTP